MVDAREETNSKILGCKNKTVRDDKMLSRNDSTLTLSRYDTMSDPFYITSSHLSYKCTNIDSKDSKKTSVQLLIACEAKCISVI